MRRVVIPESVRAGNWPRIMLASVPDKHWPVFCSRREAVTMYIEGRSMHAIKARTDISGGEVNRLVSRFVSLDEHGHCFGERALIPHARLKNYERTKPVGPKRSEQRGGMSGCLGQLLKVYPEIEEKLVEVLKDSAQRLDDKTNAMNFLIGRFMAILRSIAPDHKGWPYSTKHVGRTSIRRYITQLRNQHAITYTNAHGSPESQAHIVTGTGYKPYIESKRPFDIVELDGHFISAFFVLLVEEVDGLVKAVTMDRICLPAAIDQYSHALLAYKVVLQSEPCADDVREVIAQACLGAWVPRTLENQQFPYMAGAGFPSGVMEACRGVAFSVLSVDSHLSNIAAKITMQAREDFGYQHLLGPVKRFEARAKIERIFREVVRETALLPSTTGSHPHNGRAENAEEKAQTYQLDMKRFLDVLDVALANYNITSSEGTGMFSPLELLEQFTRQGAVLPYIAAERRERLKADLINRIATVRGSVSQGRRPYIILDRVRYTNAVLAANFELVSQKLCIEVDETDYRTVKAFLPNGEAIGSLCAAGWWGTFKHTPRVRRMVNSLIRNGKLRIDENSPAVAQICDYFIRQDQPNLALLVKQGEDPCRAAIPQPPAKVRRPVKDYYIQPDREYPGIPTPGQADNRGGA